MPFLPAGVLPNDPHLSSSGFLLAEGAALYIGIFSLE